MADFLCKVKAVKLLLVLFGHLRKINRFFLQCIRRDFKITLRFLCLL